MEHDVVVASFNPDNLLNFEENELAAGTNQQTTGFGSAWFGVYRRSFHVTLGTHEGAVQPLTRDGFADEIYRLAIEGAHSMLSGICKKDNVGRAGSDRVEKFESVHARKFHVEQQKIGTRLFHPLQRFESVMEV